MPLVGSVILRRRNGLPDHSYTGDAGLRSSVTDTAETRFPAESNTDRTSPSVTSRVPSGKDRKSASSPSGGAQPLPVHV